jgi:hypothetical protein
VIADDEDEIIEAARRMVQRYDFVGERAGWLTSSIAFKKTRLILGPYK